MTDPPKPKRTRVSLGDWPRLTRFYGLSPLELATMPNVLLAVYAEAIPMLEAQESLDAILASDMPHAEEKDRDRILRLLRAKAQIDEQVEKIDPTSAAGVAQAGAVGIGVRIERRPKDPPKDDAVESQEDHA